MRRVILSLTVVSCGLVLNGCDSKKQQDQAAAEQLVVEAEAIQKDLNAKMLEELDSGEGLGIHTEELDGFVDSLEKAAEGSSEEQAELFRKQAEALKQIQAIVAPYDELLNEFIALGGLDTTTIADRTGIEKRVEIINKLSEINEQMDQKTPGLLRRLGGEPVMMEKQISLTRKIRQTDRELFPSMKQYLMILHTHWDDLAFDEQGFVLFGENVPDEAIEDFNAQSDTIALVSTEQERLQRELVMLNSP